MIERESVDAIELRASELGCGIVVSTYSRIKNVAFHKPRTRTRSMCPRKQGYSNARWPVYKGVFHCIFLLRLATTIRDAHTAERI